MALPDVEGWVIDFRTADAIFSLQGQEQASHFVLCCGDGKLYICHDEEAKFRSIAILKKTFIDDCNCIFEPDEEIMQCCDTVRENPNCKDLLPGNRSAIYIAAIAMTKGFGVISNHRSGMFTTVHDICQTYGVPIMTSDEYFEET